MSDLKGKVIDVIWSCNTKEQLENAITYSRLAINAAKSFQKMEWLITFERTIAITQYRLRAEAK